MGEQVRMRIELVAERRGGVKWRGRENVKKVGEEYERQVVTLIVGWEEELRDRGREEVKLVVKKKKKLRGGKERY